MGRSTLSSGESNFKDRSRNRTIDWLFACRVRDKSPRHRKNGPLVWLTRDNTLAAAGWSLPSARAGSSCLEPETETAADHPGSRGLCVFVCGLVQGSSLFPRSGSGGDHCHEEVARSSRCRLFSMVAIDLSASTFFFRSSCLRCSFSCSCCTSSA